MKKVYAFNEGGKDLINILGGKGGNLSEMKKIGLPIPEGIIVSTTACKEFFKDGKKITKELENEILEKLEYLQEVTGKKFEGENPLLVSVRSGAPVSMPGMMDTILNLGMNDNTAEKMITIFKDKVFVHELYCRFIQMFSEIVMGIEKEHFFKLKEQLFAERKDEDKIETYKMVIKASKELYKKETGKDFPESPKEQLFMAVNAIFNSWENDRAILYRKINGIDDSMGTAVVIQEMVFGNLNEISGTGVAFSRNPSNGEKEVFGEYLLKAQGEDIVAGIRTPEPISKLKEQLPEIYDQFIKLAKVLEDHNKDMQDIEFTIENGKLYLLQTRNGKRSPYAAVKIAVDMVKEGILTKEEAIMKVDPNVLPQLLHGDFDPEATKTAVLLGKGLPGSAGVAIGRVMFASERVETRALSILVREETSPEDIKGISLAQGIVTVKGGATSHGAVVARGMGKCCVTGCGDIQINDIKREMYIGGHTVKEGDFISISGYTGEIFLGKVKLTEPKFDDNLKEFVSWCKEIKRMGVRMNADTPADAFLGKGFGAEGIGLCRTEHMFFQKDKIWTIRGMIMSDNPEERAEALKKMLEMQREDFYNIFKIVGDEIVIVRLLDPPLHEFLPKEPKDKEKMAEILNLPLIEIERRIRNMKDENPMLGHRGCRLAVTYPEIYNTQARAIIEAAIQCEKEGIKVKPEIMIPLIIGVGELKFIKGNIKAEIDKVFEEQGMKIEYKIGTMMETPRACLLADEIAGEAEFFSFGTNDLTQTTMGLSRDDSVKFMDEYHEHGIFKLEPFASIDVRGVGKLVKLGVDLGKKANPELEIGICGEHGGDPKSINFFEETGLDYVSCSPFRVLVAIVAAAQSYIKNKK
ncbi:pyruvate, phosphate dikinase [Fusobacterium varium]|jgi:pyruvate,orthophosphate dikinase|uniref:Pyruvate, phosphate dikinase n=1 Tax=Fusobacterium varium ATCC 27725 TaxID=469618 RepID=A0ABN5JDN9_FUSVA|nr:pyruvate, phosphate dikinase [Fusobacterium varium]AVQ30030.1 pyruvate, phosphate dikinase [Fusobacterium varium ATCC 27725]EES64949.1 pyruvate, phosphate dikinase [Fusobacterium varium ATCC 27725]MCF0170764.1 pyruvate, phosphate dikinase [Fusobacterium varium]RHG33419.1 pyruvate, phosphate dikinase [Fusobacterium varium]UYI78430.1 MAG: pyruvate, phosphate dikinase [Fusobacterium varium]